MRSARTRLKKTLEDRRHRGEFQKKRRSFDTWLLGLDANPPDALVGANFAEYGGVREHLHAIVRHSALSVALAPDDSLLIEIGAHDIANTFRDRFLEFVPSRITAVHSHVYPWFIEWCSRHQGKGARWIHTYHLPYFPEHSQGTLEPWQREFNAAQINEARHADVRISVAQWQREYLASEHGIETIYLPNGVDLQETDLADASRFVSPFGANPFVLYVGRNDPVKNPAAFVDLACRLPGVRFVMVGRGLDTVPTSEWGSALPTNLRILGELSHTTVLDAIAASALVVVTSHREGLPTLVLEAMSLGRRLVVPDEKGCMEAVGHGEFAEVYRLGNIDDLAAKTSEALGKGGGNSGARERIAREYDWRVIAPKLDAIYQGQGG